MQKRRLPAVLVLIAMLFGLGPAPLLAQVPTATYNPYQGVGYSQGGYAGDARYAQGYGQRYDANYYNNAGSGYNTGHGYTRLIPPVVGAVMGVAMGAKFGWVGAFVGGAIGLFGGKAISSAIFGDNYYNNNANSYFSASNQANYIPGMIGALIGGFMGSSFGVVGMLVGSGVGYLVGKGIAKLMFPNAYYGGSYNSPGYYNNGYVYSPDSSASATVTAASAPVNSDLSGASLAQLKDHLYETMRSYKTALEGSDESLTETRRQAYLTAQKAYFDAKRAASE